MMTPILVKTTFVNIANINVDQIVCTVKLAISKIICSIN